MNNIRHRLATSALEGIALSLRTVEILCKEGVPADIRLEGWVGPTLFTSEIGDGRLRTLADIFGSRNDSTDCYVFGSIRETVDKPIAYAAFALHLPLEEVVLLDMKSKDKDLYVNSSLEAFMATLDTWRRSWDRLRNADNECLPRILEEVKDAMVCHDSRVFCDKKNYWDKWLEEMR